MCGGTWEFANRESERGPAFRKREDVSEVDPDGAGGGRALCVVPRGVAVEEEPRLPLALLPRIPRTDQAIPGLVPATIRG